MTPLTAAVTVLYVLVGVLALVIYGLVRRIGSTAQLAGGTGISPSPGERIDLSESVDGMWPSESLALACGATTAVLVTSRCSACHKLLDQLSDEASAWPTKIWLVVGGDDARTADFPDRLASIHGIAGVAIAPKPLEELAGWSTPDAFPTVVVAYDGVVIASSYAMSHVRGAATRLAADPTRL